jgi:hypothetical protein
LKTVDGRTDFADGSPRISSTVRETIRPSLPTLSLEQIYGSVAFYLGHQHEAETHLSDLEKKWDELGRGAAPASADLQERIERARQLRLAKLA